MFDTNKIIAKLQQIEALYGENGTKPDPANFKSEMNLIAPFSRFVESQKAGFEPSNNEYHGTLVLDLNAPGITLHPAYLADNKVMYAGIVRGFDTSMINLFLIVEVDDYAYSINTNAWRNNWDVFYAIPSEYAKLLMSTINADIFFTEHVFHSFGLAYCGSVTECLNYFSQLKHRLPDPMSDGSIKWTESNIRFLQTLLFTEDLT
jgi:hypothetical protein